MLNAFIRTNKTPFKVTRPFKVTPSYGTKLVALLGAGADVKITCDVICVM